MNARRLVPALGALLALSTLLTGCTEDPVFPEKAVSVTAPTLPPLDGEAYYELWFSYPETSTDWKGARPDHGGSAYFSVGKFNVGASGNLVSPEGGAAKFAIPSGYNPNLIIDALVTVEAEHTHAHEGEEHEPGARLLGGKFSGSDKQATARLESTDDHALGGQMFSDTVGSFILVAPTSSDAADSSNGIWFVNYRGTPSPLPGLSLAPQPLNAHYPNWTYQAWLIRNEGTSSAEYVKLGRFLVPSKPDSTMAGPGAGPKGDAIFQAPGEDFVTGTRRTLNDGTYGVAISVEPIGIELDKPSVTILKLDRIPAGTWSRDSLTVRRPLNPPYLEVTVDR